MGNSFYRHLTRGRYQLTFPNGGYVVARTYDLAALAVLAMLSGCSAGRDAASEAPVALKPGKYSLSYSGKAIGLPIPQGQGPGTSPRSACVTTSMAEKWPRAILADSFGSDSECSYTNEERVGNAIKGERVCQTDQKKAPGGKFRITYAGAMTETTTELDMQMHFEFEMSDEMRAQNPEAAKNFERFKPMMEAVKIVAKAERIGDCS